VTYVAPSRKSLVLTTIVALVASAGLLASRPVDVVVDGAQLQSDVSPVTTTQNGVYVPLRSVADALGASTIFDSKRGGAIVVRGSDALRLRVGDVHATLDGMPMTLSRAPIQIRGRMMVGLQTIARAFGARVSYDPVAGRVNVMTPGIGERAPAQSLTSETQ
jgi:N-acetylmuramoyl-L-alanine amidase